MQYMHHSSTGADVSRAHWPWSTLRKATSMPTTRPGVVTDDDVRMHLRISRDECVDAPQAILGESIDASSFVETITDENLNSI